MTSPDRPKVLRNLRLSEVSWVDRPANPGAELLVFKRDEGGIDKGAGADAYTAAQAAQDASEAIDEAMDDACEAHQRLMDAISMILSDPDIAPKDKPDAIREAAASALASIAAPEPDDPGDTAKRDRAGHGDDDQSPLPPSGLFHDLAAPASGASEDKSVADTTLEAQLADLKARLDQAETAKAAAESKATETEKRAASVEKGEGERFAKIEADLRKAAERAEQAEALAKAERDAREFVELTKRAGDEFPFAGKAEAVARELRRIAKIEDPAERAEAEDALKTRNAARKALTRESGQVGRPDAAPDARAEFVTRLSKALTDDPKLGRAEAAKRVMADAEFAQRYDEEVRTHGH